MNRYLLRTLGGIGLDGPAGPIEPSDRLALPLLAIVALSPGASLPDDQALLLLTPELTPAAGDAQLVRAIAALEQAAGAPLLRRAGGRLRVDPGSLELDVEPAPGAGTADAMLTGFALPNTPELAEWAAAARTRFRPRPGITSLARAGALRPITSIAVAIGGLLLLGAVWVTRTTEPAGFTRGDPIVIADLDNVTGDSLFDGSLVAAATVALEQSPQLSVLRPERVTAARRRLGLEATDRLTIDRAAEVAVRENVRFALGLRLEPADAGYRITAELREAESGALVGRSEARAETTAGTLDAVDQVVDAIRGVLGERRTERRARSIPLPAATTPSLEALRAYAHGTAAWAGGEYQIARELWERALDLDSGFAMAMGALGGFGFLHHDRASGRHWYREALRRADRLTEWERLRLEEGFASARGDGDSALAIHRILVRRHPSGVTWFNFGTELMHQGRHRAAIAALETSLEHDAGYPGTWINLATAARGLGEHGAALGYYGRAERLDSNAVLRGTVAAEYGNLLVEVGRERDAERHFRRLLSRSELFDRIIGSRGLGYLAVREGRLDQAVGFFRTAGATAGQQGDRGRLTRYRSRLAESAVLLLAGDTAAAGRAVDSALGALRPTTPPGFAALAGFALARLGRDPALDRLAAAVSLAADTTDSRDRDALHLLDAERALRHGEAERAIASFRRIGTSGLVQLARLRLVEALALAGRRAEALTLADSATATPLHGIEAQLEWPWTIILAGDLAAAIAPDQAVGWYRRLVSRWEAGDSTAPPLRAARRRIGELEGRR